MNKAFARLAFGMMIVLLPFLSACSGDDDETPVAEYLIVNNINSRANISLYDYNARTLTESIYTIQSQFFNPASNAAKKDDRVAIATNGNPTKLVVVDANTGEELHATDSWTVTRPFVGFHNSQIILSELSIWDERLPFVTKVYSENLVLQDSIAEEDVLYFDAATIVGSELFYSIVVKDVGGFIKAKNLNTKQTRSVTMPSRCAQLLSLGGNKLLAVSSGKHFIIDTNTMSILETVSPSSLTNAAFDAEANSLYFLRPAAQPSAVAYFLSRLDLATGEQTYLNTNNETIVPPLVYDAEAGLIITGGLKVFSKEGEVLHTQNVPGATTHIFKK